MLWTVWKIYTYSIDQWPKQSRVHQKPAFRRLFRALSTCRFCPKTFSTFCSFSQVRPQNTRLQGFYDFNRSIWSRSLLLLWQLAIKQQTWQCKITFTGTQNLSRNHSVTHINLTANRCSGNRIANPFSTTTHLIYYREKSERFQARSIKIFEPRILPIKTHFESTQNRKWKFFFFLSAWARRWSIKTAEPAVFKFKMLKVSRETEPDILTDFQVYCLESG